MQAELITAHQYLTVTLRSFSVECNPLIISKLSKSLYVKLHRGFCVKRY